MKIDLTAKTFTIGAIHAATDVMTPSIDTDLISQRDTEAVFQVYDDPSVAYVSGVEVNSSHQALSPIGWDLVSKTQAQIEAI